MLAGSKRKLLPQMVTRSIFESPGPVKIEKKNLMGRVSLLNLFELGFRISYEKKGRSKR